jgi:hypothetical protein
MQIKDLEVSRELGCDEKVALVGGGNLTGVNTALVSVDPGIQAGNAGPSFASPVINTSIVVPVVTQVNTGINLEQNFDNDVAALIGSVAAVQQ